MEEKQTTYITTYIFPQMDSEELSGAHAQMIKTMEKGGANILQSRMPMLRKFAYPISKRTSGFMGDVEFVSDPASIHNMTESLNDIEGLTRFMITKKGRPEKKIIKRSDTYKLAKKETEEASSDKEKIGIEDIDKKLEEIMENVGDS